MIQNVGEGFSLSSIYGVQYRDLRCAIPWFAVCNTAFCGNDCRKYKNPVNKYVSIKTFTTVAGCYSTSTVLKLYCWSQSLSIQIFHCILFVVNHKLFAVYHATFYYKWLSFPRTAKTGSAYQNHILLIHQYMPIY